MTRFWMGGQNRLFCVGWGLLVGVALLCALTACQAKQAPETEIEFWSIALKPKFVPYMEAIFQKFESEHPGVKVRWLDLPQASVMSKLMACIAGGVSPDVVNLTTETALKLARRGALADLEQWVSPAEQKRYLPNLWKAAQLDGGVYAIPWYLSTRVLIYNSHLLEQAGWQGPPPNKWEDVAALARQVRQRTGVYGYEPVVRLINDWKQAGVPIFDSVTRRAVFNTADGRRRLAWYGELRRDDIIPEETLIEGYQGAINRYKQGKLALLEAGPQLLLAIKADAPEVYARTAITALPTENSGVIPAALMNLVVPQASKNRALAVELALLVTSKDNQLKLVEEVPMLPSTVASEAEIMRCYRDADELFAQAMRVSCAQLPHARDLSLDLPRSNELEKVLKEAVETVFYGQDTPERALERAEEEWNKIVSPR